MLKKKPRGRRAGLTQGRTKGSPRRSQHKSSANRTRTMPYPGFCFGEKERARRVAQGLAPRWDAATNFDAPTTRRMRSTKSFKINYTGEQA